MSSNLHTNLIIQDFLCRVESISMINNTIFLCHCDQFCDRSNLWEKKYVLYFKVMLLIKREHVPVDAAANCIMKVGSI